MVASPLRYPLVILFVITFWFVGRSAYHYVFDTHAPEVVVSGIEHGGYYSGDVPCVVTMRDAAKVAHISLYLDGKPLVVHYKINKRQAEHTFMLPTTTLPQGKHELKIDVVDGSYRANCTTEQLCFIVDNQPLQAAFVRSDADLKVFQGRVLHVVFQVNKSVKSAVARALGAEWNCVPEDAHALLYELFLPVQCEERPNEYPLSLEITDHVGNTVMLETKFQVVSFPFPKQHLILKQDAIDREKAAGVEEQALEQALEKAAAESPDCKLWRGSFYAPIEIRGISTAFGTIRTTEHRGKYAHKAVDLLGEPKGSVWAAQSGVIVIQERYAHSGNTVAVDHGCGIISLYFHLDSFSDYKVGDKVQQGYPLGRIGKTGFASGYHLHWEMRVKNRAIDPLQWIKDDF